MRVMWVWVCNCGMCECECVIVLCVWGVTCHNWAQFVSQPGAATAHSSVRTISHLLSPHSAHSAVAATYFTPAPGLTRISVQWARCVLHSWIAQEAPLWLHDTAQQFLSNKILCWTLIPTQTSLWLNFYWFVFCCGSGVKILWKET